MSDGATPVLGHGTNNLDNGLDLGAASQHDVFMSMAQEMLGIEPDEPTEPTPEEVEPEEEVVEEELEEDTPPEKDKEEEPEEKPDSEIFVVKVDGEEIEVSEDELLNGYQRQKDYTRKTQELATERNKIAAYAKELEAERTKYVEALENLIDHDKEALKKYDEIDWAKLKAEDTNAFLLKQYEMNEARTSLKQKLDAKAKAQEQAQQEKVVAETEFYKAQNERAKEIVEGWKGEGHEELIAGLQAQAKVVGFTEEEEDLFRHAIVIKLLQKAKAYDDLKATQTKVVEKKIQRKAPKVVTATEKEVVQDANKGFHDSFNRLKQTGDIRDSVDAFAAFL